MPHVSVEWAHRTPTRPLQLGKPPRPMLPRLLNYWDRETMLCLALVCSIIHYNGGQSLILTGIFSWGPEKQSETYRSKEASVAPPSLICHAIPSEALHNIWWPGSLFESATEASDWIDAQEADIRCHPNAADTDWSIVLLQYGYIISLIINMGVKFFFCNQAHLWVGGTGRFSYLFSRTRICIFTLLDI